ncbi:hypothetical protein ENUP19_0047G0137 [Entamoeba nuttalli]|uniref:Casein kinase II subunit beta n=2 Tax=Entamoeba nuttalli TaxID=412467 RepID=K2GWQ9_ENTNP|nr:casein kinase II regulatory subunit family protein [Entamoeba nuttalli P19]EKE38207.1 casein kinase II regulatory subunit family protein [Entamoeba nuttalli P19]|eukprot:XP_008859475.1 casein kinase II regulatory subunit family protein [Entamoeba nuttalli P19]
MIKNVSPSDPDSDHDDLTWIQWFCSLSGNEYFVEVDEQFIDDEFNLYGLDKFVTNYESALNIILNCGYSESKSRGTDPHLLQKSAMKLYGLIHARFILSPNGMKKMKKKINENTFGRCQRLKCSDQNLLPVGIYNTPGEESVKLFCPRCGDLYIPMPPHDSHIDGAFIGTNFPHLFMLQYPDVVEESSSSSDSLSNSLNSSSSDEYVPTIFGFKINTNPKKGIVSKPLIPVRRTFVCY